MEESNQTNLLLPSIKEKLKEEILKCNQRNNKEEHEKYELKFNRIDFKKIKETKQNLPLKPCIRCTSYINYETHSQAECAAYQHENFHQNKKSSYENSNEEQFSDEEQSWRNNNKKYKGKYSFETNDQRRERQKKRFEKNPYTIYEQQIINETKNKNNASPHYNIFKWNLDPNTVCPSPKEQGEELNLDTNWLFKSIKNDETPYDIIHFIKRNKKRTICIEGNIGCGKSTLLKNLTALGNIKTLTLAEPLQEWRDFQNINLLEMMYDNPQKWALTFQNYTLLTMAKNHTSNGNLKFMERSIFSTNYIFTETHKINGTIDEINWKIFQNWFNFILQTNKIKIDTILYLKTSHETAFERIKIRGRPEEKKINLSYIESLHKKYDDWLIHAKNPWPCQIITINANQTPDQIIHDLNRKISLIH